MGSQEIKISPKNVEEEKSVLGAMLIEPEAIDCPDQAGSYQQTG